MVADVSVESLGFERGGLGIGPWKPAPAHSGFSFHDRMGVRACGGIARPTSEGSFIMNFGRR